VCVCVCVCVCVNECVCFVSRKTVCPRAGGVQNPCSQTGREGGRVTKGRLVKVCGANEVTAQVFEIPTHLCSFLW